MQQSKPAKHHQTTTTFFFFFDDDYWCEAIFIYLLQYKNKIYSSYQKQLKKLYFISTFSQVQKIPNMAYQIYQTLQIYLVYEKDYIKYKYDRK